MGIRWHRRCEIDVVVTRADYVCRAHTRQRCMRCVRSLSEMCAEIGARDGLLPERRWNYSALSSPGT